MVFSCFPHAPFPGATVSESLAASSRAAGEAYARRVLRLSAEEREGRGGTGGGGKASSSLLLLQLIPSSAPSSSSISSLPASDPPPLPPTDSLALLKGLEFEKDDKEDNYGRVLAVPFPLPPPSSSASSSSTSTSCSPSSFTLPRPSLLDPTRDEGSISLLEAEIRVEKDQKVRPRRR